MPSTLPKPRLFALLVAINEYPSPVPPLNGCVNDLMKVAAYLQQETDHFEVEIIQLFNEQATKAAIVEQFRHHLGKASQGDIAFFYYSGHGTQEEADPVFWLIEEDRDMEALVCYDSYVQEGSKVKWRFLADKELRYLVHQVSQSGSHVVTIFDCCHSGGNTRNGYVAEQAAQLKERRFINRNRMSQKFPLRDWQDFIFSSSISYEQAKQQPIGKLLPEGRHIQMAACQHDESAYEINGAGVFTRNLLHVLTQCKGQVTYYDLQSRIQNYIKYQFDQTPRVYVVGDEESGLFQGFLQRKVANSFLYGNVTYNKQLGWIMDLGAMQGVASHTSRIKLRSLDEEQEWAGEITEVYPTYSLLSFTKAVEKKLDQETAYQGLVTDCFAYPLALYINLPDGAIRHQLIRLISSGNFTIHLVDAAYKADYTVQFVDQAFLITRPATPTVPVVQPRTYTAEHDLTIVANYIVHLSQFEFIKQLHNPNAFLFNREPIQVNVFHKKQDQPEVLVGLRNGELQLAYEKQANQRWGGSIRIALKNTSDRKLYCALLYLSFDFGVTVKLLKEVVVALDPNREVWVLDGAPLGLTLEEEVLHYNYPESVSYLKLMVSTTDFKQQVTRFEMPSLPSPLAKGTKGLALNSTAYSPGTIEDWTTRLIPVRIKNPAYKLP